MELIVQKTERFLETLEDESEVVWETDWDNEEHVHVGKFRRT